MSRRSAATASDASSRAAADLVTRRMHAACRIERLFDCARRLLHSGCRGRVCPQDADGAKTNVGAPPYRGQRRTTPHALSQHPVRPSERSATAYRRRNASIRSTPCPHPQTARRPSNRHSPRSTGSSERARSCGWAATSALRSRSSPPARSPSTSRSASADCRAAASSRSTARSPRVRRRSRSTRSPTSQRAGGIAAFIDAEHALDPEYAQKLGVDIDAAARLAARHG